MFNSIFPVSVDPSWSQKIAVYVVVALQSTLPPGYTSGVTHEILKTIGHGSIYNLRILGIPQVCQCDVTRIPHMSMV